MQKIIGVLGGMGPLATVEFMKKVITQTPAAIDQEHIPMLIRNIPQIPDRTQFILGLGADPYIELSRGFSELCRAGATCIVIPCNTAHFWYDRLASASHVHMISIIQSVANRAHDLKHHKVGILATDATIKTSLYQLALQTQGIDVCIPEHAQQVDVMNGIKAVKAGQIALATALISPAFEQMIAYGADAVILGCTEIPIALNNISQLSPEKCLDSLDILAHQCVLWAREPFYSH
jgi:aspartate racemase